MNWFHPVFPSIVLLVLLQRHVSRLLFLLFLPSLPRPWAWVCDGIQPGDSSPLRALSPLWLGRSAVVIPYHPMKGAPDLPIELQPKIFDFPWDMSPWLLCQTWPRCSELNLGSYPDWPPVPTVAFWSLMPQGLLTLGSDVVTSPRGLTLSLVNLRVTQSPGGHHDFLLGASPRPHLLSPPMAATPFQVCSP